MEVMKTMNKFLTIFVTATILLCSNVPAQELEDISVEAGVTGDASMTVVDIAPSENLGALVSKIVSTYKRYIEFLEQEVWAYEQIEEEQEYDLLVVPANSPMPVTAIIEGVLLETTSPVDIEDCLGCVFETYECTYNEVDAGQVLPVWNSAGAGNCPPTISGIPLSLHALSNEGIQLCKYNSKFAVDSSGDGIFQVEEKVLYDLDVQIPVNQYSSFMFVNVNGTYDYSTEIVAGWITAANLGEVVSIVPAPQTVDVYALLPLLP